MQQTICDQCSRVVSKAMTGFRLVTVDDEPAGADLCSARCLNDASADASAVLSKHAS